MSKAKVGLCIKCHSINLKQPPPPARFAARRNRAKNMTVETVAKERSSHAAGVAVTAIGRQPTKLLLPKMWHAIGEKAV
jgi:hypothetical protein